MYKLKPILLLSVMALSLLIPFITEAGSAIEISRTGQTISYATGDDGDIQAGVAWPSPRFTDNGDETVTDNLTGLMWAKNADILRADEASNYGTGNHNFTGLMLTKNATIPADEKTWQEALNYVASLNSSSYSGFNDWRLPNMNELRSLVNISEWSSSTWLDTQGFNNVQTSYWSSSNDASSATGIYIVWGFKYSTYKSNYRCVWPVRGGQIGSIAPSDLVVKSIAAQSKMKIGKKVNVSAVIKNIGKKTAPSSAVQFYLSSNNNTSIDDGDTAIGQPKKTGKIKVKAASTVMLTWKVSATAGDYYLKAFCDSNHAVAESNEGNNIKATSKKISIK